MGEEDERPLLPVKGKHGAEHAGQDERPVVEGVATDLPPPVEPAPVTAESPSPDGSDRSLSPFDTEATGTAPQPAETPAERTPELDPYVAPVDPVAQDEAVVRASSARGSDEPPPYLGGERSPPKRSNAVPILLGVGVLLLLGVGLFVYARENRRPDLAPQIAELAQRVAALESRPVPPAPDLSPLTKRADDADQALAAVKQALAALQSRVASVESTPPAAPDKTPAAAAAPAPAPDLQPDLKALDARVSDLDHRLGALDESLGALGEKVAPLGQTLGTVDQTVGALQQTVAAIPRIDLAPVTGRLDGLDGRVKPIEGRLDAVEGRLGPIEGRFGPIEGRFSPIEGRLDAIEGRVKPIEAQVQAASTPERMAETRAAPLAVTAESVRRAIDAGRPFKADVDVLRRLGADARLVDPLAAVAADGAPTLGDLRSDLATLRDKMLAESTPVPSGSYVDRILTGATNLVRVRPLGSVVGDTPGAILGRMDGDIGSDNLATALDEWQKLPEPARASSKGLADRIRLRLAAETAARTIGAQAIQAMTVAKE